MGTGSHSNQVYADCVDLSAVENASKQNSNNDPSIVVAKQNNALQIFALDDAAARLGLEVGLPLANARAICPQLRVFDADEVSDAKTLNDIADWCDRFTPLVALDLPHGLFLDITGCAHLFGGEAAMMRLMCDVLTAQGFAVSAAIAGTSVCARTITRHVHGRIVRDGEEADAVKPLPVSALGADEAITRGLRRAGLKTIGDVASRARHEITARFGADFTTTARPIGVGKRGNSVPYKFLSDEWMTEAKKIREEFAGKGTPPAHAVRMNQIITDVPFGDGTVNAHLDTSGGDVELDLGHLDTPDLTVTLDYETAKAIIVDQNPQAGMQAFMAGKIKVQGDMTKLMAMQSGPVDPTAQEVAARIKEITE